MTLTRRARAPDVLIGLAQGDVLLLLSALSLLQFRLQLFDARFDQLQLLGFFLIVGLCSRQWHAAGQPQSD